MFCFVLVYSLTFPYFTLISKRWKAVWFDSHLCLVYSANQSSKRFGDKNRWYISNVCLCVSSSNWCDQFLYGIKERRIFNKTMSKIGKLINIDENCILCKSARFDEFPSAAMSLIAGNRVVVSMGSMSTENKNANKIHTIRLHLMHQIILCYSNN